MADVHFRPKRAWLVKDEETAFVEDLPSELKAHRGVHLFCFLQTNTVEPLLSGYLFSGHDFLSGQL